MNELIKISESDIDGRQIQTVSARDLHAFLEIGKDFSTWIKAQIERARLLEGRDFLKEINIPQKGERQNQGLSRTEYHHSKPARAGSPRL
jgi:anti-repressor protein